MANWVSHEEEKTRLTEAAMAEVDQNVLIAHEDMLAWSDSLDTANPLPLPQ